MYDPEFQYGKPTLALADVLPRFLAWLIDGVVVNILAAGVGPILARTLHLRAEAGFFSVSFLVGVAYAAAMISSEARATLGKMALGLVVTDIHGQRLTPGRALAREASKYLSTFACMLGYLLAAFTERKQALHDLIAGTLVFRTR